MNLEDAGRLADLVASHLRLRFEQRQEILAQSDVNARLQHVERLLAQELELLRLEQKIQQDVQAASRPDSASSTCEQMRAIQDELASAARPHRTSRTIGARCWPPR